MVIHSVLEQRLKILRTEPFLEVIAGYWITGESLKVPDIILAHIFRAINEKIAKKSKDYYRKTLQI